MPTRLGRYLLLEKIGQGGMAEVFAARLEGPQMFSRACVVKRLRPELASLPHQVQLFLEEARLSALLQHPCVVQVFDVGESEDGQPFFAMERIDGPPLSRVLEVLSAEGTPMPLEVCAWIGARAAEGLHFAHELVDKSTGKPLSLVHRDVSPQNILLGLAGDVKVADFGIAKADVDHRPQTRIGITKGKLAYMSPEQARGERVDRRTDVYGLGVVLWEALTGRALFEDRAQRRKLESTSVPPPSTLRRDVDGALDTLVQAMLSTEAKNRTPTLRHVEEALDRWLADTRGGASARGALQALLRERLGALRAPDEISSTEPGRSLPAAPRQKPAAVVSPEAPTLVKRMSPDMQVLLDAQSELKQQAVDDEQTRPTIAVGDLQSSSSSVFRDAVSASGPAPAHDRPATVVAGRAVVALPQVPQAPSLPTTSTSFVGRRAELTAMGSAFDGGARLVTLQAPGGSGKTRLALRFAEELRASGEARSFPGGLWFADLAAARDGAGAVSSIARALGVPLRAGRTLGESQAMLGHAVAALGRALLIVDDCDPACAEVIVDLSRRCPRARVLVTAEQVLGAAAEIVLEVSPLHVHDDDGGAVELFLDRARAARNGHALSDAARGVVGEIVKKLDGVPLAIELAAARAATESPSEILQNLGRADVRTLRTAIGDTYEKLGLEEKRAFRQASVFRGGFDLDAALAVLDVGDDDDAGRVIERLRGRSLIVSRPTPHGARFSMLDALFELAGERLTEASERQAAEARHAGHYVALGKKLGAALLSSSGTSPSSSSATRASAAERLELEVENLSVVVERIASAARPSAAATSLALEAALALEPVLSRSASATVQLKLLESALALADGRDVDGGLLLRAHLARGEARRLLGAYDQARADLHAALDLATARADLSAEGRAQTSLGALALSQGKLDTAEVTLTRALKIAESARDDGAAGRCLAQLGKVSRLARRLGEATARSRRAIELSRAADDERAMGRAYVELASALLATQEHDVAAAAARTATATLAKISDRRSLVHAWGTLSIIEVDRQRWEDGESAATQAVDLAVRVGERRACGLYLGMRGAALHGRGALLDARELYTQASRALFDAGDDGHGAYFCGALGAVHAALDDVDGAAQSFAMAERRLRIAEAPLLHLGVGLFEGLLGLARAGDGESRGAATDELRRRIETATAGVSSPFSLSEEVRFAVRVVRAALI